MKNNQLIRKNFFIFKFDAKYDHENKHSLATNLGLSRQDPNFPREIPRQKLI